jgi:D-glycero-D-manno-heptose 1,7-bisphosphate phosphatase
MKGRAVFVDRDGVINHNWWNPETEEWESPICAGDFRLRSGVLEALAKLSRAGFYLILVSNQPSAAKGKCSFEDLRAVHDAFESRLDEAGIRFEQFCYAYGHPGAVVAEFMGPCPERKPGPLFLEQAITRLGLDRSACWMVGDRDTDIACGRNAGIRTIQVRSAEPDDKAVHCREAEFHADDLAGAAQIIMAHGDGREVFATRRSAGRSFDSDLTAE